VHHNLVHLVVLITVIRRRITHLIPLVKNEDQGTYRTPLLVVLFFSHFVPLFPHLVLFVSFIFEGHVVTCTFSMKYIDIHQ